MVLTARRVNECCAGAKCRGEYGDGQEGPKGRDKEGMAGMPKGMAGVPRGWPFGPRPFGSSDENTGSLA